MSIENEWKKAVQDNSVWSLLIKNGSDILPQEALSNDTFKKYVDIYDAYSKAKNNGDYSDFLAHGNGTQEHSLVNSIELEDALRQALRNYSNLFALQKISMLELVSDEKLRNNFTEEQILFEIKRRIPQNNATALIQAPLNISQDTQNLMKVAADLLNDQISDVKIENDKYILYYKNGETFDLSECIANANLSHVSFSDADLHKKFVDFAYREGLNHIHPDSELIRGDQKANPEYFRKLDPDNTKLSHLSDAEIAGINIYTTYSEEMNDFLEGKMQFGNIEKLKEVVLSSLFCAAGLNKTPVENYHTTYRGSSSTGASLEEKKRLAITGELYYEKGFTSTSFGTAMEDWIKSSALIFTGGILGQNISLISCYPKEKEILILPTQIQYLGSYEEEGITYFLAKSVRTISGLTPEFQGQKNVSQDKNLNETELKNESVEKSSSLIFSNLENSDPNHEPDDKTKKEFVTQQLPQDIKYPKSKR